MKANGGGWQKDGVITRAVLHEQSYLSWFKHALELFSLDIFVLLQSLYTVIYLFPQNSFVLSSSHEGEEVSKEAGGVVGAAAEEEVGETEEGGRGCDVGGEKGRVGSIEEEGGEGEAPGEEGTARKQPLALSKSLEV